MRLNLILGLLGLVGGYVDEEDLAAMKEDPAAHQLVAYKMATKGQIKILTVSSGAPVEYKDTNSLNDNLVLNPYFLDSVIHVASERIPERVVHAKGAGAFGFFDVTHDITKYCKAKLFENVGKRTPLVVRFSNSLQERGSSDLVREARGYAVKFYTEDGNWDMVGFSTPVYFYRDPEHFMGFVHSQKKNQVSAVRDANAIFDFMTLRPETLHGFLWVLADGGIPDGYRHMSGFSIHTYELVNDHGESHFARFHFITDQGIKNLPTELAIVLGAQDPDYSIRDLYNTIANGSYPSWTMYIEVMTKEEVEMADFDPFDVTLLWPKGRYPLLPVGKLVLNRNPNNYFADVEQLALNPGHLVPGIVGAPDKMFEGRVLAYRDTQNYRLGVNHNKIPVNCPMYARTYNRDGASPVNDNEGRAPHYYPNSFNGPMPYVEENRSKYRYVALHSNSADISQASYFYEQVLEENEKTRLVENVVRVLSRAVPSVQRRTVKLLRNAHADLGNRVAMALGNATIGQF